MRRVYLSTIDNPFDPETQFSDWYDYDESHDYGSCSILARITKKSDELSYEDNLFEEETAIDDLIANDFQNIYKKIVKED